MNSLTRKTAIQAHDGFTLICPVIDADGDVTGTHELPVIGWEIGGGGMSFPLCPMETPQHYVIECPTPDGSYNYVSSWLDHFEIWATPDWSDFFAKRLNKSSQA